MTTRRQQQVSEFLREEVSEIIHREMKDPRLGMASIVRVEISPDLRYARLFVSVLGSRLEQVETLTALNHATGFIRHLLKPRMRIRHVPELVFNEDHSMEHAAEMARTLRSLNLPPETREPETTGEAGEDRDSK